MRRPNQRPPLPVKEADPALEKHRPQRRRRVGLLIAALMVAILLAAFVAPATASAHQNHDTLVGQVTKAGPIPLAGVKVEVLSGSTVVAKTMTGWGGYYRVAVAAGTYDVRFSRTGYETLVDPGVIVAAPSTTLDATLVALPKLMGQVTKAGPIPLAGVKVEVLSGSTVVAKTMTGWGGYYRVAVAAGTYDVRFSRTGYETLVDPGVIVAAPSTTLDATLVALPKLMGQVTKAGPIPLAGVKVEVLSGSTVVAKTMTGWGGYYRVAVAAGTYDVRFSRTGYETLVDPGVIVAAPSTTLDATLVALPKLMGQVTKAGPIPLAGVKVEVLSGSTVVAKTMTGWGGYYRVAVAAGTYDVRFSRTGYETLVDPGVIVAAPSTTLDATLVALPKLMGQVTKAGPIPLAGVKVEVLSGSTVVAKTMTGWGGYYRVAVAAGTYDVRFSRTGYETLVDPGVIVAAPSTTLDATLVKLP